MPDPDPGPPAPADSVDRILSMADSQPDAPDTVGPRGETPPPSLHRSEGVFWHYQAPSSSSPFKQRDTIMTNTGNNDKNPDHQRALPRELGEIYEVGLEEIEEVLRPIADEDAISAFISQTDVYQDGRWMVEGLPLFAAKEEELYKPCVAIISEIVEHFYPAQSLPSGVEREVVDSHSIQLPHDDQGTWTLPDIAIRAAGSSFEVPDPSSTRGENKSLGYTNLAAVIDAKKEESIKSNSPDLHVGQVGIYCRQIYLQQPNRNFVRSLILTERSCRFVHYDHSGVYVSPLFDIHSKGGRELFVRCILSLSSPDEATLGLDTTVQWEIDDAGRKISGKILDFNEESNATIEYKLNLEEPVFVRPGIRGRGTVGWNAWHPGTGEEVVIKDSWRSYTRDPEWEWLGMAQGVVGIPKLFGYKDLLAQTKDFRPQVFGSKRPIIAYPDYHNRIKSRLFLKKYGLSIWYFRSRLQLVKALRGALVAHRDMYTVALILHRDVAVPNILLGSQDEPEGPPGILVDLDMAIPAWRMLDEMFTVDPRSAYRFYVSIANIRSIKGNGLAGAWVPPHNYTDELEAFFYVITHIMYHFKQPGVKNEELDPLLQQFRLEDDKAVIAAKTNFILRDLSDSTSRIFSPYWGGACVALYAAFHKVIKEIYASIDGIRRSSSSPDIKTLKLKGYALENVQSHYDDIIGAFDAAIEMLTQEGLNAEELHPYPDNPEPYPLYRNPVDNPKEVASPQHTESQPVFTPVSFSSSIQRLQGQHRLNRESRKRASEDHDLGLEKKKRTCVVSLSSLSNPANAHSSTLFDSDSDDDEDNPVTDQ